MAYRKRITAESRQANMPPPEIMNMQESERDQLLSRLQGGTAQIANLFLQQGGMKGMDVPKKPSPFDELMKMQAAQMKQRMDEQKYELAQRKAERDEIEFGRKQEEATVKAAELAQKNMYQEYAKEVQAGTFKGGFRQYQDDTKLGNRVRNATPYITSTPPNPTPAPQDPTQPGTPMDATSGGGQPPQPLVEGDPLPAEPGLNATIVGMLGPEPSPQIFVDDASGNLKPATNPEFTAYNKQKSEMMGKMAKSQSGVITVNSLWDLYNVGYGEVSAEIPNVGEKGFGGWMARKEAQLGMTDFAERFPKAAAFKEWLSLAAYKYAREVEGGRVTDQDVGRVLNAIFSVTKGSREKNIELAKMHISELKDKGANGWWADQLLEKVEAAHEQSRMLRKAQKEQETKSGETRVDPEMQQIQDRIAQLESELGGTNAQ